MSGNVIAFRDVRGALKPALEARAEAGLSANDVARRDLERYYATLEEALPTFSAGEAALLVDALKGSRLEVRTARLLWATIEDAIRMDGLEEKWGVDGAVLVVRLRALSAFEALAVVDGAERFWNPVHYRQEEPLEERLRAVGFVQAERS